MKIIKIHENVFHQKYISSGYCTWLVSIDNFNLATNISKINSQCAWESFSSIFEVACFKFPLIHSLIRCNRSLLLMRFLVVKSLNVKCYVFFFFLCVSPALAQDSQPLFFYLKTSCISSWRQFSHHILGRPRGRCLSGQTVITLPTTEFVLSLIKCSVSLIVSWNGAIPIVFLAWRSENSPVIDCQNNNIEQ